MNLLQIPGNSDPLVVMSATGSGPSNTTFIHNTAGENSFPGPLFPAVFEFAITDIVGSFSSLQINLEWSPITATGTPQFQTIGTWAPLTSPTTFFPCSATGTYRLNCTAFSGGTSFNIYASIASSMPQGSGGGGGGGSVTQGTVPWIDNVSQFAGVALGATAIVNFGSAPAAVPVPAVNAFITNAGSIGGGVQFADASASGTHPIGTQLIGWNKGGSTELAITALLLTNAQALHVAVVDGTGSQVTSFGGGVQFADNAASGATPTGTLSMGWDSVNSKVRALKVDASQNLLVAFSAALPAGTNVIGHVIVDSGAITVSGSVSVSNFPTTVDVTDRAARLLGVVYGSQAQQLKQTATNFNLQVELATGGTLYDARQIRALTSADVITVNNFPATQNIAGVTTDGSTTETNFLVIGGESNDATAQYQPIPLGTGGRSIIIEGVASGTAVPVSLASTTITGTVAVTQSTSPWIANLTQVATTVLGTPQTFGTAPTGVVIGTSSDTYIAGTRARSNQTTTAAGVQDINIAGVLGVTNSVTNGLFCAITDNTTKAGVIVATTALKTDLSSVAGTATVVAVAGVQLVGIEGRAGTSLETTAGVLDGNIKNVGNSAVVTSAAGQLKVGITGNAAATLDSTIGAATAPTNALAISGVYQTTVPALTTGQAVARQTDTTGSQYVNTTGRTSTYRMAVKSFVPVASATSPTFSIQGSATKTIRILRLVVTTSALTGAATPFKSDLVLQKFSVLSGGTTGSTPTGTLMDSGNAAQTAICLQYSAVPTTATAIGGLTAAELIQQITSSATVNGVTRNEFDFGDKNGQGLVLRGAAQYLGITINPLGTTPLMSVWIEWAEDNS